MGARTAGRGKRREARRAVEELAERGTDPDALASAAEFFATSTTRTRRSCMDAARPGWLPTTRGRGQLPLVWTLTTLGLISWGLAGYFTLVDRSQRA